MTCRRTGRRGGPHEQRRVEQAAAEARADRDRRGRALEGQDKASVPSGRGPTAGRERAVAGAQHLRVEGEAADRDPQLPGRRRGACGAAEQALRRGHAQHQQDAGQGRNRPQAQQQQELLRQGGTVRGSRPGCMGGQDLGERGAGEALPTTGATRPPCSCRSPARTHRSPGQRRRERCPDGAGCAAADQGAQVVAAQARCSPRPS